MTAHVSAPGLRDRTRHAVRGWRPARPAGWIPVVLAVLVIAGQISYPNYSGAQRDVVTVVTVLLFAAASLTHVWLSRGPRSALTVAAVFAGGGLLVEVVGVATGFPFGSYSYSDRIGPLIGEVPVIIPLAWAMMGYPALVVARQITPSRWLGTSIGAAALAAWDLYLDPQMVTEGYWTWEGTGPYLIGTVPASNYLAWLGTAWLMMMAAWHLTDRWSRGDGHSVVPVALYVWTWSGSAVAHILYFDLVQSGVYGGVCMGLIVGLLAWARLRQPTQPAASATAGPAPPEPATPA